MSSSEPVAALDASLVAIEALLAESAAGLTEESVQRLMTAAVRVYMKKTAADGYCSPVTAGSISATDAMMTTSALLHAVNVAVFELGLWQSWNAGAAR